MGSSSIYKSTDTSAPALIATTGGLITVLDGVLVNGYGTFSPLGWTKEYQSPDNLQAVYRNKGTGWFLRVNNSIYFDGTYSSAKIEVFEVMKDWETGYLRCPEGGVDHYIAYADTHDGGRAVPWWIIGDDKGFWFCAEYDTPGTGLVFATYLGDYIPYHLENESNWISFASINDGINGDQLRTYTLIVENESARIPRTHLNALSIEKINFYRGLGIDDSGSFLGATAVTTPIPILAKPLIGLDGLIIGEIPGLLDVIGGVIDRDILEAANGASVHIFTTYGGGLIGLIEGEGFRP